MSNLTEFRFHAADIDTVIPFDPAWSNGTGYFDHAVTANLDLKPGQIVKSISDNDRLLVIVGTTFGNAVFFERYSPETTDGVISYSPIITSNVPMKLRGVVPSGAIANSMLGNYISEYCNIGLAVETILHEGF